MIRSTTTSTNQIRHDRDRVGLEFEELKSNTQASDKERSLNSDEDNSV